jgi:hypothetical protein
MNSEREQMLEVIAELESALRTLKIDQECQTEFTTLQVAVESSDELENERLLGENKSLLKKLKSLTSDNEKLQRKLATLSSH